MESWKVSDPYPGAMLRIKMNDFYHYGIYVGNDEVVQFGLPYSGSTPQNDIKVIKTSFSLFCDTPFFEVREYSLKEKIKKKKDDEIVKFALSAVGMGGYDIVYNNCEHFVNECVFGEHKCQTVDEARKEVLKRLNKNK